VLVEEALGPFQVVDVEQEILADPEDERTAADPASEPRVAARTAGQKPQSPSATRNPTKGMTASLGTGAIMLSSAISRVTPA